MADLDPDVDAIFRLTQTAKLGLVEFGRPLEAIGVTAGVFTPYNSQNTLHTYNAFWGLLLPPSKHFRITDIWCVLVAREQFLSSVCCECNC